MRFAALCVALPAVGRGEPKSAPFQAPGAEKQTESEERVLLGKDTYLNKSQSCAGLEFTATVQQFIL